MNTKATPEQAAVKQATAEARYLELDKIDPMSIAEDVLGENTGGIKQSYKSFDEEQQKGMLGIHLLYNDYKRSLLEAAGDTTFSMDVPAYIEVVDALGFERIYQEEFVRRNSSWDDPNIERRDTFYMYVHREHELVLSFDTYTTGYDGSFDDGKLHTSINGGKWFGVWQPDPDIGNRRFSCTSSGGFESLAHPKWRSDPQFEDKHPDDLVWVGYWDCREGLKSHINQCLSNGQFVRGAWPKLRKLPFGMFNCGNDWYTEEYETAKAVSFFGAGAITDRLASERRQRICEQNPWFTEMIGHSESE